jgi:hypothetical protein
MKALLTLLILLQASTIWTDLLGSVRSALVGQRRIRNAISWARQQSQLGPAALVIACGVDDSLVDINRKLTQWLTAKGVRHIALETPGAHT